MTFYYSIKQMFRSPLKSFLLFLLIGVSAFFLALGGNLWNMSSAAIQEFENIFTTVGTVEQVKKEVKLRGVWDAEKKTYTYYKTGTYGEWTDPSVLDFAGADYILKPEQRPYFGAYLEEYTDVENREEMTDTWLITVEAVPLVTAVADHSIPMRVTKVLEGGVQEGEIIYICQHTNPEPDTFEEGKTYIMRLNLSFYIHGPEAAEYNPENPVREYDVSEGILSTQYTSDGEQVYDPINESAGYDEVTEGFYETVRGKRWLASAKTQEYLNHTVPVQPTDGTKLLMPFYRNEAVISQGRDITAEEYEAGEKVCLIPEKLARNLEKSVGDELTLPLYYANFSTAPVENFSETGGGFGFSLINAKGEFYPVFHEQSYRIVGVYAVKEARDDAYGIGKNEVVIPGEAVPENCWKDNIVGYSPMRGATTSFQIPNGTVLEYQKRWAEQGVDDLEIIFYDDGYTQLKEGIDNRKMMSQVFLITGCVMALMVILFFSNLFITGQQERIAVERLLGRTKRQCTRSMLTGMLVFVAAGSILGSAAGWKATESVSENADTQVESDTTFSNSVIENTKAETDKTGQEASIGTSASLPVAFAAGGGLVLAAFVICAYYMRENLKKEPLELLGRLEE